MRLPRWIVPLLVLAAAAAGIGGARLFAAPSFTRDFEALSTTVRPETARLTVRGLKCVDTARTVAGQLDGAAGVLRYVAYASRNEALVTYDPARINPEAIAAAIEGPVFVPDTGEILFHQYKVLSIRSGPVE